MILDGKVVAQKVLDEVRAGVTRLRFSRDTGTVTLATYNAHPHLDAEAEPGLVTYR